MRAWSWLREWRSIGNDAIRLNHRQTMDCIGLGRRSYGTALLLSIQDGSLLKRRLVGRGICRGRATSWAQIGTPSLCAQLSLDVYT